ncbi:MAG: aldehyde dehydrogenase family protein [Caldilineaceae bacterium]
MSKRKPIKITYSTLGSPDPLIDQYFDEALATVQGWMGQTHQLYINGEWRSTQETFEKRSPVDTSLVMGRFQLGRQQEINDAMAAAKAAYPQWRATPWQERVRLLRKVVELVGERMFEIGAVNTMEVGKNRLESLGDVEEAADFIRVYCDSMEQNNGFITPQLQENEKISNTSVMKSYGVWAVISPFNFPIALSGGPTAAALVTGNTVVLKPAEDTPFGPLLLAQCFVDAGLPPGVFNFVTGDKETGRLLVDHPDVAGVTFTGSYKVGMDIYSKLAQGPTARPVIAEMGGKNATIVSKNANLDKAVQGVSRSAFGLQGQKCSACSRVYVHESIKEQFVQKLAEAAKKIKIGDPSKAENWMGPVSTAKAYENYKRNVADMKQSGAQIATGGETLEMEKDGYFVAPTVVADLPQSHPLWKQEMFLPIITVASFGDLKEAMQQVNDVPFGLTSGFYSEDEQEIQWFLDNIETGVTYINRPTGSTTGAWPRYQPFGGWKGSTTTGIGSGSTMYLLRYMREQSQTIVKG